MKRLQTSRSCGFQRGAASVEFAAVLPILLMFIFGIVEFGRVLTVNQALVNSAREGARVACLPGASNANVQYAVEEALQNAGLQYDAIEFEPSDIAYAQRDEPVKVMVRINYNSISLVTGFISSLQGMQLEGASVMRKEGLG
jgi:Flp pilus assembly protein TadG